jgi:hypothetical protein
MTTSNLIPQHDIDRAKLDIVSVISGYVDLKRSGKEYSACCPFHKEKSPSFSVSEDKGFFYCFGCGAGGSAIDFVMLYDNVDFPRAVRSINGDSPSTMTPEVVKQRTAARKAPPPPFHVEDAAKSADILSRCATEATHQYFKSNATAPMDDCLTLQGKLIVPLTSHAGEIINLASLGGSRIAYAAGGQSYGATARIPSQSGESKRIILCLDYADGWRLWWKLRGQCEIRCAIGAENFAWMVGRAREQFTAIACQSDEAEHYREVCDDVIVIDAVYGSAVA